MTALFGLSCSGTSEKEYNWASGRKSMVAKIKQYGVHDEKILSAMGKVKRHLFIPKSFRSSNAYADHPLPIGHDQTISQPFIVAYMTEKIELEEDEKVLEIGTGSGYQAAILAEMGAKVFSIEIISALADHAKRVLKSEGYESVKVLTGDGYSGWPEYAPFDVIIVTCAPAKIPQALVQQLKDGGRMIVPVGKFVQHLVILRKRAGEVYKEKDIAVRFVPMVKE
ncbi:protein-L-isoaspartate(D-aspartate) O-methyltransferase [PVC group bacterium]|nr:protein-L-isoaspartate(D-aspartate) O-methyltransferase [PVC group bacterium]